MAASTGEFRRGWPVVLASLLGIGLGLSPLAFYTLGVFAPYLEHDFGWSIGAILAGITVQTVAVAVLAPVAGLLTTRLGARPVALVSVGLFSLAFMSFALSNGSLWLFYATWVAQAVCGLGTLPITWTRVINQRFVTRRGLALGLALMGTGLFGFLVKPFLAWLIPLVGWRGGYVAVGLLPLLIAFPVALRFFHDRDEPARDTGVAPVRPGGLTLGEALRDWRLWLLAGALVPVSLTLGGPVPNIEAILTGGGLPATAVPGLASLVGLSALTGRVAGGWLVDRFWAPAVACVIIAAPGVSCWLLTQPLTWPLAATAICLIGFALGVEYDLMAYFVARYFGMRDYGVIYGLLYVAFALGAGFGPLLFGWDFDLHGNYHLALRLSFFVLIAAAVSLLLLGRYRDFPDERGPAPA